MKALTKQEAVALLPAHVPGRYNPAKYVLGGYVGTPREVLMHLYQEAVRSNIERRASVEAERIARQVEPLNRAMKSGNRPKMFWQHPRDITVRIPAVRQYGDAWLVFTNCKLNGGQFKAIGCRVYPEMTDFESALRQTQQRELP